MNPSMFCEPLLVLKSEHSTQNLDKLDAKSNGGFARTYSKYKVPTETSPLHPNSKPQQTWAEH